MNTEELGESLKKVEEAMDEIHEAEVREKWLGWLALSTGLIAVLAAIVGLFETQATSKTILAKNEAILFQSRESDQWNFYQAKSIKGHIYEVNAKLFPAHSDDFKKMSDKYNDEKKEIKDKADGFEKMVEGKNKESERYYEQHHVLAFAETFLQISIALSSIAALTRKKGVWYVSILMSLVGAGSFLYGVFR